MSTSRVLVADDDAGHRMALAEYLRLAGYEVVECGDGAEALERIPVVAPDLLLLDVDMPRLDGLSLLQKVRELPRFEHTPVLFLSAVESRIARVRGLTLGADDFVTKPFDRTELLARIRGVLRRAVRHRAASDAVHGDVAHLGFDALLQTLDLGRRSARLVLEESGGELLVEEGQLVDCRYGRFAGIDAFTRLLWIARGRFRLDGEIGGGRGGAPMSLQAALMTAVTSLDDARRELSPHREDAWVEPAAPPLDPALARLAALYPLILRDLAILMDGGIADNARRISAALAEGRLREVTR